MATTTYKPSIETYVYVNHPTTNYSSDTKLVVGYDNTTGDGYGRSWLQYDLDANILSGSAVPVGSTSVSASLQWECYYGHDAYNDLTLQCQLCTDNTWTSGINWNTAPNASVVAGITDSVTFISEKDNQFNLNVSADVITQLTARKASWRFKANDEPGLGSDMGLLLWKYSFSTTYPVLVVTYTPPVTRPFDFRLFWPF